LGVKGRGKKRGAVGENGAVSGGSVSPYKNELEFDMTDMTTHKKTNKEAS